MCLFCQESCEVGTTYHEECYSDYFAKRKTATRQISGVPVPMDRLKGTISNLRETL